MKIVPTWMNSDLMDKEIRSADNKEVGHVKAGDESFLGSVKGMKSFQIPREAIAAFDGDKVYLRASEAEVLAGIYPFIAEDRSSEFHKVEGETPTVSPTRAV